MINSLALATDLMVRMDVSTLEQRDGYALLRTPSEPDFWFGNAVVLQDAQETRDLDELIALSLAAFPEAEHVCLQWDVPDLELPEPLATELVARGFELDVSHTLVLRDELGQAPLREGLIVRPFEDDADWAQAVMLSTEIATEAERDPPSFRSFIDSHLDAQRARVAAGRGQWFGVFDGGRLVTQMGVIFDAAAIRFQHVETAPSHRRMGLCAALLTHVGNWAMAQAPEAAVVIVADESGNAGRIYRRAGFALAERITSAVHGDYAAGFKAAVT